MHHADVCAHTAFERSDFTMRQQRYHCIWMDLLVFACCSIGTYPDAERNVSGKVGGNGATWNSEYLQEHRQNPQRMRVYDRVNNHTVNILALTLHDRGYSAQHAMRAQCLSGKRHESVRPISCTNTSSLGRPEKQELTGRWVAVALTEGEQHRCQRVGTPRVRFQHTRRLFNMRGQPARSLYANPSTPRTAKDCSPGGVMRRTIVGLNRAARRSGQNFLSQ
mmetsp:Transcript_46287/g.75788  ORF Transcript_46287/g.75788 Transcript_46287/m.75788 type:complete len:221 (+) Transcript_46287:643-1305(+)